MHLLDAYECPSTSLSLVCYRLIRRMTGTIFAGPLTELEDVIVLGVDAARRSHIHSLWPLPVGAARVWYMSYHHVSSYLTSPSLSQTDMVDVFPTDEAAKLTLLTKEMTVFFLGLYMCVEICKFPRLSNGQSRWEYLVSLHFEFNLCTRRLPFKWPLVRAIVSQDIQNWKNKNKPSRSHTSLLDMEV